MDYKAQENDIRGWFKDHVAKFSTEGRFQTLEWGKPGTSNYWSRFIISGGTLIVYGDVGDAIYTWSDKLTFQWLSKLNLGYFAGKCQASENGRQNQEWDAAEAKRQLMDRFETEGRSPIEHDKFEENYGWDAIGSEHEWIVFLSQHGYDVFRDLEGMGDIGKVISMRCQGHLLAIQLAVAQEEERLKSSTYTAMQGVP